MVGDRDDLQSFPSAWISLTFWSILLLNDFNITWTFGGLGEMSYAFLLARLWTQRLVKSTQANFLFVIKVLEPLYLGDIFNASALAVNLQNAWVTMKWHRGSVSQGNNQRALWRWRRIHNMLSWCAHNLRPPVGFFKHQSCSNANTIEDRIPLPALGSFKECNQTLSIRASC